MDLFKIFGLTIAIFFVTVFCSTPRPVVLWHGMGDTCCYSFSMGAIKNLIQQTLPGTYVFSVMMGSNMIEDEIEGFLGNSNNQVSTVCEQFANDPNLKNGFNAVGFSQGSQFLRAYVERCNSPPVYNLITMGGQHMGVADIPNCEGLSNDTEICKMVETLLAWGAYTSFVQNSVIQAQYFRDPMDIPTYLQANIFLPDINNENSKNQQYKNNLISLNNLVLFEFSEDTVVVPKESEWFGYYADGDLSHIIPVQDQRIYKEDWIGLKTLDEKGKLQFLKCPGEHMQIDLTWFSQNVVTPWLDNSIPEKNIVSK